MESSGGHSFSGDIHHTDRARRVSEAITLCAAAGFEVRPYALPPLQKSEIRRTVPDLPCFYIARDLKKSDTDSQNKTMYTRMTGALFYSGNCYAVYNTRGSVMKWSGRGEIKAANNLLELMRMNAGLSDNSSALLLGSDADVALRTILESDKSRRPELRFDRVYRSVRFVPLDKDGARLLKMLTLPDWNERLLSALFNRSQRSYNRGAIEYDAIVADRRILCHLDSDIARLLRFRDGIAIQPDDCDILCFPWQVQFLREFIGGQAMLRVLEMSDVEATLGLSKA
jgi:hypothetical protein